MDKEKVRTKLIELLKIPLTKVDIGHGYVDIWLNQFKLGTVVYDIGPADIPIFSNTSVKNELRWDLVYSCFRNELGECIKDMFGNEFDLNETIPSGFSFFLLKRNVNDKSPVKIQALFDGINWKIYKV